MQGTQKIVNLGLLIATGGIFLFLMKLVQALWGVFNAPRMGDWIVAPPIIVSAVLAAGGGLFTRRHENANRFLNEVTVELSKVTWPDRKETTVSTGVTCVLVLICALVLFAFDSLWGTILSGLL